MTAGAVSLRPGSDMATVILKNIGKGPGLTVIAFDPEHAALIGDVDVIEPLGPGDDEAKRLGRVSLRLRQRMVLDSTYELYYQDTLGTWHLTRFRPRAAKMECTFIGEAKKVPTEVKAQSTVSPT
jgi:hypothetical protein